MWIGRRDIKEGTLGLKAALRQPVKRPRTAKYPVDQKMFHHAATIATLGAAVTGVLMMYRVDNFLLPRTRTCSAMPRGLDLRRPRRLRNRPHLPCDRARVYFAIRPEKRWMTWSMINGWITRDRYLENHDPERWAVPEAGGAGEMEGSAAGGSGQAALSDRVRSEGP